MSADEDNRLIFTLFFFFCFSGNALLEPLHTTAGTDEV